MTLALLLMAVTGAWAQSSLNVVEFEVPADWATDNNPVTAADLPGFKAVTLDEAKAWTGAPAEGYAILFYSFDGNKINLVNYANGGVISDGPADFTKKTVFDNKSNGKFYYTATEPTEWELKPDDTGKKWILAEMPASDVELQVEYFAESNLFLSKDALADKGSISVKAGDLGLQFGDDGKSANTITEGTPMTVTYNGTKKVIGVKVEKGGGEPVLLTTITAADNSSFKSGSQTFGDVATVTLTGDWLRNDGSHGGWYCQGSNKTATISVAEANGANITSVKFYTAGGGSAEDKEAPFEVTTTTVTSSNITTYLNGNSIGSYGVSKIEVYGTK